MLFGLVTLGVSLAVSCNAWAGVPDDSGHDPVELGLHAGPIVVFHHDPEDFAGEPNSVGTGGGFGFSVRLRLEDRFAIEPLLEASYVDGLRYYGYTGSAGYAFLGVRFVYAVLPQLDLYVLLHLGGVAGGNSDGTPVFGAAGELGAGARYRIWGPVGVFIEPRFSVFTAVDGSDPFAPGFKLIGGPAVLW